MKITILGSGTSQGVPVIACDCLVCKSKNIKDKRLRSSVMIEVDNQVLIIDSGPDFRQQMLNNNVINIDAIIFTHHHKDHVAGLDDVRAYNHKWNKFIEVYCNKLTSKVLNNEYPYIFSKEIYPGTPKVNINLISNNDFYINKTKIIPISALHYKLPVFGYRINDFIYLTDVSYISDDEKNKMLGADLIVLDALRIKPHLSHFNLSQAISVINELQPKKALFTHISHYMGLHDEINKTLPNNINLSYDGQIIFL
ncbi:MAG: MBL fold metallo-hydrolase [Flavobacteriales bacterium]|nr:MBL fold metallo-hydrolase [Flavobacteriales bacterium]